MFQKSLMLPQWHNIICLGVWLKIIKNGWDKKNGNKYDF